MQRWTTEVHIGKLKNIYFLKFILHILYLIILKVFAVSLELFFNTLKRKSTFLPYRVKKHHSTIYMDTYSAVPNNRVARNKRVGYYIGLFGYYIKNTSYLIKIFEKIPK